MRGVQNKTHRKTSSYPEEVPYRVQSVRALNLDQQSPLSENLSGKSLPSSPVLVPTGTVTLGFLLSDKTRKAHTYIKPSRKLSPSVYIKTNSTFLQGNLIL